MEKAIDFEKTTDNWMSLKSIIKRQKEHLLEVANFHAKLREIRDDLKEISEHYNDNGDTWVDADDALNALGALLADLAVYTSEYEEDLDKPIKKEKTNEEEV